MAGSHNGRVSNDGIKRMTFIAALLWFAGWAYVAWRGLSLIADAKRFISLQPPGGIIPQEILSILETGQHYVLRAALFGAVTPVLLSIIYWIYRGFVRVRSS